MKNLTITLLLLISATCVYAQGVWAPAGATWHYEYSSGFGYEGYVEIKYTKDSVIDGQAVKVLEKTRHGYDHPASQFKTRYLGNEYTYMENNVVYFYRHNQFYTLYDFNATASGSWEVSGDNEAGEPGHPCDKTGLIQVDSVETTSINSMMLKTLYVHRGDTSDWTVGSPITERIGSHGYMFPEAYMCMLDANEGGQLRCYYDDSFGTYNTSTKACNFIVGIGDEVAAKGAIQAYPNPATTKVTVELPGEGPARYTITVISVTGQALQTLTTSQRQQTIDLSNLENGVYLIRVKSDQGDEWTQKITKGEL